MRLDHTIVPAKNSEKSGRFYAEIFGIQYVGEYGHFIAVKVNGDLKLLFKETKDFKSHHYAFKVSDQEYSEILNRVKNIGIAFGDSPADRANNKIYQRKNETGFYFDDENGHILEVIKNV